MLHRPDKEGLIVITQPAHAWVSGQLARAWGNETFGDVVPREEVCVAAELHDIGFLAWEESPTLNPKTGRPHSFLDLPAEVHFALWSAGIRQMLCYDRYAALLVSLHFSGLAQRHPVTHPPGDVRRAKDFLRDQRAFQDTLMTALRNDPQCSAYSSDEPIGRNRQLVSLWDWMSLLLCMGFSETQVIHDVPTATTKAAISLTVVSHGLSTRANVAPWPFQRDSLRLICEGRRLVGTFNDESAMRDALRSAVPVTMQIELVHG